MWWKWISTASAGQGLATVPRVLPHTQHPHLLQKSYQSENTKKEVANCPAFTHFISQQGLGILTELQWFHSHPLVATDNQLKGLAGRHMSA